MPWLIKYFLAVRKFVRDYIFLLTGSAFLASIIFFILYAQTYINYFSKEVWLSCSIVSFVLFAFFIENRKIQIFGSNETNEINRYVWDRTHYIRAILIEAKYSIVIFSDKLHHEIYDSDEVIDAFKILKTKIQKEEITLRIYLRESVDSNLKKLPQTLGEEVFNESYRVLEKDIEMKNFLIVDDKHIRVELDYGKNILNGEMPAFIRFNNPKGAGYLMTAFNEKILLKKSEGSS